ncbi:hypothetical protein ACFE04_005726 [Oxalis oulophora]
MAIELLSSDNSNMSPRISFSHDISQCEIVPVEQQRLIRSNSTGIDFDFCVRESFESSSADELFSDGKILPTEVKKKKKPLVPPKPNKKTNSNSNSNSDSNSNSNSNGNSGYINQKESSKIIRDETEEEFKKGNPSNNTNTKSFWGFKRSNSLNSYGRSFCPLPLLSRSNSTGSTPNDTKKQQKIAKASSTSYQKPPLKRNIYGSNNSNGHVRINPVLNVPSANLFGLGSLFSNGTRKDKNKKK